MTIKKIVTYSLISAIYVVLSLVMGSLSFAGTQIRIAELLMIFCIFDKEYILPITLGCFLTNLIGIMMGINAIAIDLIFGTLATFLSGVLMYRFRNIKIKNRPLLSLITPAVINGLVIGLELAIFMNSNGNFLSLFIINTFLVFLGEFVSVFVLGLILYIPFGNLKAYIKNIE